MGAQGWSWVDVGSHRLMGTTNHLVLRVHTESTPMVIPEFLPGNSGQQWAAKNSP